jgi:predicted HTH domain antitoxin
MPGDRIDVEDRKMTTVQIRLPDDLFSSVQKSPDEVAHDMRVAVAVRWYAQGIVSQGRAAEIAGMPRSEFMRALSDAEVSPFQETAAEVREALTRG